MGTSLGYFQLDLSHMTGHADIDMQHQTMARMLHDLAQAAQQNAGSARCQQLFDQYVAFTRTHFQHEEQLMTESQFPLFQAHRDKHEKLLLQLTAMREALREDDPKSIASDAFEWLIVHIERNDCELGSFLKSA